MTPTNYMSLYLPHICYDNTGYSSITIMSKHLTIEISDKEAEILKRYCIQEQRTQTDVVRTYIRSLEILLSSNSN